MEWRTPRVKTLYFFPEVLTPKEVAKLEEFTKPKKAKFLTCQGGYKNNVIETRKSEEKLFYTQTPTFLREHQLWFDPKSKKWNILFYCNDSQFRSIYELSEKTIWETHNIENLFFNGVFKYDKF
jgi:hypothetical protein